MAASSSGLPQRPEGEARGSSLWLLPEEGQARAMAELIRRLSARFGTPPFDPHVTLVGGVSNDSPDLTATARALADALRPLTVPTAGIGAHDEYFRCVVVELERTAALLSAQERAVAAVGAGSGRPFAPHLSLVYGQLDEQVRAHLLTSLTGEVGPAFHLDRLALVRTTGPPEAWDEVEAHGLR